MTRLRQCSCTWSSVFSRTPRRLELARNGFKSHIRAYATHIKEERVHFDIGELHLGHIAKSYALREPPRGVGAGVDRKARKGGKGGKGGKSNAAGAKDDDNEGPVNQDEAKSILRKKGRMLMSGADEFNIG